MNHRFSNIVLIFFLLILSYIIFNIYAHYIADKLLFKPPKKSYQDNKNIIKLMTPDGKKISAIYLPHTNSEYVILYSHGNATDLGKILPLLMEFHNHGYAIFAYDYHGYGTSEGVPTEKNTYFDINAAYNYMVDQLHIPPSRIIAMGSSLGAAITTEMATHKKLAAVILTGPFVSAFRVYTIFPILPFDKYNNLKKIIQINVPILIIHGENDQVIPVWHGKKLYNEIKGKKQALWVQDADHNNLVDVGADQFWLAINKFVASLP